MAKYLRSGRRRDMCVLLASAGELRGQELKSRLESHYDERIEPKTFYGSLDALEEAGHVESRTEGVNDVYALTEAGRQAMLDHLRWVTEQLEVV